MRPSSGECPGRCIVSGTGTLPGGASASGPDLSASDVLKVSASVSAVVSMSVSGMMSTCGSKGAGIPES